MNLSVGNSFAKQNSVRTGRLELIVPIRDRRQGRRFLTLRNIRNVLLVLAALFVVITIGAKLRGTKASDDFGRLYGRQVQSTTTVPKHPEIIQEGTPIADDNSADPMLLAPQARAQLLLSQSNVPQTTTVTAPPAMQSSAVDPGTNTPHVAIVGGPEGVTLARENRPRPVLSGGFGKQ